MVTPSSGVRPAQSGDAKERREELKDGCENEGERVGHTGKKREGQTERRWKDGVRYRGRDREEEVEI